MERSDKPKVQGGGGIWKEMKLTTKTIRAHPKIPLNLNLADVQ